jgi:hypothetical protein
MKIALIHDTRDAYAGEIVRLALTRSFTSAQVTVCQDSAETVSGAASVWINPPDSAAASLAKQMASGGKALVLGQLVPRVADALALDLGGDLQWPSQWAECSPAPESHHEESPAAIRYSDLHPLGRASPLRRRPLCRFDFSNEWNNMGYGRITLDRGPWALQSAVGVGQSTAIAHITTPDGRRFIYSAVSESQNGAAMWFNRGVGPVDSLEWRVVESFLGDYRADELPCFPYFSEIPAGYRGAVNARLDCDEAVAASRPLLDLYREYRRPLSLALLTGQTIGHDDLNLMRQLIGQGGSVVSHSVDHAPDWGGTYQRAVVEAERSRDWFEQHLPEAAPVRFAVSPFHQNPPYAVSALADSGYDAFVGGIIANDPEYLLGRAGRVPFAPRPMVSLSAQCMLHGDCYHRQGDSVDVYCESFDQHVAARSIFAYLDHPFSARYQYGWPDEATRLTAHRRLIEHIDRQPGIWWASLGEVLNFLCQRDAALVEVGPGGTLLIDRMPKEGCPPLAILWKGQQLGY